MSRHCRRTVADALGGIKLIQEQFNHCPLSVVTGIGGFGTPMCPCVYKHSCGEPWDEVNLSTPPIKCLAGTLAELRFLVAGVLQAGNTQGRHMESPVPKGDSETEPPREGVHSSSRASRSICPSIQSQRHHQAAISS